MSEPYRSSRAGLALAVVVVAALSWGVVGATPAVADDATVDEPTIEPDESVVGATETHTVTVTASDVDVSDGAATLEVDLSAWADGDVGDPELVEADPDDVVVDGPDRDGDVVRFDVDDADEDAVDVEVVLSVPLTHPTTPTDDGETYEVRAAVVDAGRSNASELVLKPEELDVDGEPASVENYGDGSASELVVDSNREGPVDLEVSAAGLDDEQLTGLFGDAEDVTVDADAGDDETVALRGVEAPARIPLDFEDVPDAEYVLSVGATDTGATADARFEVADADVSGAFGEDVYEVPAGEMVEVDVSLSGDDDGYVLVGGDSTSDGSQGGAYLDLLYVGGGRTLTVNTRLLGSNAPAEVVYGDDVVSYEADPDHERFEDVSFRDADGEVVADDLESLRGTLGISQPPWPLRPDRFRLVAGAGGDVEVRDDGVPDLERPLARSNLLLTDGTDTLRGPDGEAATFGNVTTHVAPAGAASSADDAEDLRGELTARDRVAEGDRVVFEFEAAGLWSVLSVIDERVGDGDHGVGPEVIETLLALPEGFVLTGEETNPGPNEDVTRLDVSGRSSGLYLVPEGGDDVDPPERYYLVVDTRGGGPFDGAVDAGDEYDLEMGYVNDEREPVFDRVDYDALTADDDAVDRFPYFESDDGDETRTASFQVEEPTLEYDRVDSDDRPVVANVTNGTVSGETNLAPGTDVTLQLVADNRTEPTEITIDDVDVERDGRFRVDHDFSALRAGEGIEVEFYVDQRLFDKRGGTVRAHDEAYPTYEVAAAPAEPSVSPDGDDSFAVTVQNGEGVSGSQTVDLAVDGEVVADRTVELDADDRREVTFEGAFDVLDPGAYDYAVATDDDEASGQLVVEDARGDGSATESGGDTDGVREESDEEGRESPDDGDDAPPDGDDRGSGGLFGVPVRPRDLVGGAIIVGTAHVLGHWT